MGVQPDTDADLRTAEQAAEWLVRLDSEDCTDAERAAFERWRNAHPMHAIAYRQAQALWRDSNAVIRNSMALSRAARHALHDPPERSRPRRWWLEASSFAAAAVLAVFLYWPSQPTEAPAGTRYATLAGEQRDVSLDDGSRLTLDTQTVLVERYSPGERRVDLQQGQAQFEVQGNRARPFVVHARGGTITAIGTRFQIRIADAGTTVSLLKGHVRVAARQADGVEQAASLQAGQSLRIGANGMLGDVLAVDRHASQGWLEGKLYVDNWRLQDFVVELNRYSDTQLRIEDPALREVRISGVFQTRNRNNLQRLLAQGWGIQSQRVAGNAILLTRQ